MVARPNKIPMPPNTPIKKRIIMDFRKIPTYLLVKQIDEGSYYKIYLTNKNTVIRIGKKRLIGEVEYEILRKLRGSYINNVLEYWCEDGYAHFEMEYCKGDNLERVLQKREKDIDGIDRNMNRETCYDLEEEMDGVKEEMKEAPEFSESQVSQMSFVLRDLSGLIEPKRRGACGENYDKQEKRQILFDPFNNNDDLNEINNSSNIFTDEESKNSDIKATIEIIEQPKWVHKLMRQLGTVLERIHRQNIIHMDIKPSNILRSKNNFVLCDFNISKIGEGKVEVDGDPLYMAPEILRNKCYFTSDIFSLGLIYLRLCNPEKKLPKMGDDYRNLRINSFEGWKIDEIGIKMLEQNPKKRCTAKEVREYFKMDG